MTKYTFEINVPDDLAAGLRGFDDVVHVEVASGEPGGDEKEFAAYIKECLEDWYDAGHDVVTQVEVKKND